MLRQTDQFYANLFEPNKGCLLALREVILAQDPEVTETKKYGMPCFCYRQKPFCYLWIDKKTDHPYLLMVEGMHLNHPELEAGNRAKMKTLTIDPNQDLPMELIATILGDALGLYKNGKIKIR